MPALRPKPPRCGKRTGRPAECPSRSNCSGAPLRLFFALALVDRWSVGSAGRGSSRGNARHPRRHARRRRRCRLLLVATSFEPRLHSLVASASVRVCVSPPAVLSGLVGDLRICPPVVGVAALQRSLPRLSWPAAHAPGGFPGCRWRPPFAPRRIPAVTALDRRASAGLRSPAPRPHWPETRLGRRQFSHRRSFRSRHEFVSPTQKISAVVLDILLGGS